MLLLSPDAGFVVLENNMQEKIILNQFFPYQLVNLSRRVSSSLATTYQEQFGLTIPQWRVLACVGEKGNTTAKSISRASLMDKVKTSRAIAELMKKNLLEKKRDTQDSRVFRLRLNQKGSDLYNSVVPYAKAWENDFLSTLADCEYEQLKTIMHKLNRYLDGIE